MRAGSRVPEERADLIRGFGREDVFELAGLLFDLCLALQRQTVGEKPLRQTMTANNVGSALAAAFGQFHDHAAISGGDA